MILFINLFIFIWKKALVEILKIFNNILVCPIFIPSFFFPPMSPW